MIELTVYFDLNKPIGTEIEVFYRIQNKYDFSKPFENQNWYRTSKQTPAQFSKTEDEFFEETYQNLNISYTNETKVNYTDFKYFSIKIVMYSENSSVVPKIKNLRVIATV